MSISSMMDFNDIADDSAKMRRDEMLAPTQDTAPISKMMQVADDYSPVANHPDNAPMTDFAVRLNPFGTKFPFEFNSGYGYKPASPTNDNSRVRGLMQKYFGR